MASRHECDFRAHRQHVVERSRAAFEDGLLHPFHIDLQVGRSADFEAGQRVVQGQRIHRHPSLHGEIVIPHVASADSGECRKHGRCAAAPGEMQVVPPGLSCQGRGDKAQAAPRPLRAPGLAVQSFALACVRFESDGIHRCGNRQQVGDEAPTRADVERHQGTFGEHAGKGRGTEDRRRRRHAAPIRCLNRGITRSRS